MHSSQSKHFNTPLLAGFLLSSLFPIALIWILSIYNVDAPFRDEWEMVPLFDKLDSGTLAFTDLAASHNQQIPIFPKIFMLILARLTNWNIFDEKLASIVFVYLTMLLVYMHLKPIEKSAVRGLSAGLLPVLSLLLFSMKQSENWLMGWQLTFFMNLLAVTAGLGLLADLRNRSGQLIGAIALGIIATFSISYGTAFWPIGLLILLFAKKTPKKNAFLIVWASAAVGILAIFSILGSRIFADGAALSFRPGLFTVYIVKFLGAALSDRFAALFGTFGLSIFAFLSFQSFRDRSDRNPMPLFFLGLGAYAITCAVLSALGRMSLGSDQALSSRYITFGQMLWIADLALIWRRWGVLRTKPDARRARAAFIAAAVLLSFVALNAAISSFDSIPYYRDQFERLTPAKEELTRLENDDLLLRLYPDPALVKERARILKRLHLSLFRFEVRKP